MKTLYLRNIKQGFATNSSSYHSTITRWIEIPEYIWIKFKEQNDSEIVNTTAGGYSTGFILKDDEGDVWNSYNQIRDEAEDNISIKDLGIKDGISWVRIIFETTEEGDM